MAPLRTGRNEDEQRRRSFAPPPPSPPASTYQEPAESAYQRQQPAVVGNRKTKDSRTDWGNPKTPEKQQKTSFADRPLTPTSLLYKQSLDDRKRSEHGPSSKSGTSREHSYYPSRSTSKSVKSTPQKPATPRQSIRPRPIRIPTRLSRHPRPSVHPDLFKPLTFDSPSKMMRSANIEQGIDFFGPKSASRWIRAFWRACKLLFLVVLCLAFVIRTPQRIKQIKQLKILEAFRYNNIPTTPLSKPSQSSWDLINDPCRTSHSLDQVTHPLMALRSMVKEYPDAVPYFPEANSNNPFSDINRYQALAPNSPESCADKHVVEIILAIRREASEPAPDNFQLPISTIDSTLDSDATGKKNIQICWSLRYSAFCNVRVDFGQRGLLWGEWARKVQSFKDDGRYPSFAERFKQERLGILEAVNNETYEVIKHLHRGPETDKKKEHRARRRARERIEAFEKIREKMSTETKALDAVDTYVWDDVDEAWLEQALTVWNNLERNSESRFQMWKRVFLVLVLGRVQDAQAFVTGKSKPVGARGGFVRGYVEAKRYKAPEDSKPWFSTSNIPDNNPFAVRKGVTAEDQPVHYRCISLTTRPTILPV